MRSFDIQGTLTPLLGIGVCVSIQFGALEYAKRVCAQRNIDQRVVSAGPDGKLLTPTQLVASGAFAGIANGFVSGPVEHIRIRTSTPFHSPFTPLPNPPLFLLLPRYGVGMAAESDPIVASLQDYRRNHPTRDCITDRGTRCARSGRSEVSRASSRARSRRSGASRWGTPVTSSAMRPSCSGKWSQRGSRGRKCLLRMPSCTVPLRGTV